MMVAIEKFLYILSGIFYYPVVIALVLLFGKAIIDLGSFCRESWQRRKNRELFTAPFQGQMQLLEALPAGKAGLELQAVLHNAEQLSLSRIKTPRYIIKMGPTLGLIGTLTPMAKALSGLSQGDFASLGNQMVTAFSTTVLGLVTGGIAFTIMHTRSVWMRRDMFGLSKSAETILLTTQQKELCDS